MASPRANNRYNVQQWSKPAPGPYLVMLKRYLLRLQTQHQNTHNPFNRKFRPEYPECNALEQISHLIREIEPLTSYGCFGLDIGKLMHPSDYGIFGYTMMNCETLMCALRRACERKNILNRELSAEFISDNNLVIYKVNSALNSKEHQVLLEVDFSTAFEFAQRLVGPLIDELKISSVHFSHRPLGPVELYLAHFKCPVYFGESENKIIVEKDILETRVYGANPKVLSVLEDKIGSMSDATKNDSKQLKLQVTQYVKSQLGSDLPSAQSTAKHFNMSLSAFKKRLHLEGSCYQLICDEVRFSYCRELMRKDTLALKEIAFNLGFTNASAFNRAFKRWSGESPSGFKKRSYS